MTVVCLGSGPSLSPADVAYCRGKATVIAINTTYKKALWADHLYAGDLMWWRWNEGAPDFKGRKYSIEGATGPKGLPQYPDVFFFKQAGREGLSLNKASLCTGGSSGYAAINLAVHLGARRVVLLGYDYSASPDGRHQHHAPHPPANDQPEGRHLNYPRAVQAFDSMAGPLMDLGVEVVNCSRQTALCAFRQAPLQEVL